MRFWKGSAYLVIEFNGYEQRFDVANDSGRRLALDFDIKLTNSSTPNQAVFALYNLSPSSRSAIASDGLAVRCYAGYDGVEKLVFQGSFVAVQNIPSAPDWITKIQAGDGYSEFTESVTSRSYAAGTDKQIILKQMSDDMGLIVKSATDTLTGVLSSPMTFDGKTKDTLNELVNDAGAAYSIQDGELQVVTDGQPVDQVAIVLRADTGLLESPIVTKKGVNVKALLNPDLRPNKLIKLESIGFDSTTANTRGKDYNGVYLAQSVQFVGNNYGGAFDVNIEAIAYD